MRAHEQPLGLCRPTGMRLERAQLARGRVSQGMKAAFFVGGKMDTKAAITTLSQGEKIKAGLIWSSQCLALLEGLGGVERAGGVQVIRALLAMIGNEVALARKLTGASGWEEIPAALDRALVMIDSGVPQEANSHLSQALSKTTSVLQQAMSFLRDQDMV